MSNNKATTIKQVIKETDEYIELTHSKLGDRSDVFLIEAYSNMTNSANLNIIAQTPYLLLALAEMAQAYMGIIIKSKHEYILKKAENN